MKENLFLSLALDDSGRYFVLNINVLRGLPSLISDINNNPGLLFLKCETTKKLYKAEIVKMEVIKKDKLSGTNDSKDVIYINFKNDLIKITLLKKQKAQQEELKLLYARSKKDFVGIYNHSLYYTYGRRKFKYARPVLANEIMKGELTPKLLENFYIIPEEDGTLFGKIIEEDNDYIVTLTNDRMIDMDSEFLRQENDEVNKVYRPYFYEFFIDKTETKKTQKLLELNTFYTVRLHSDIDDMSPDSQSEVLKGELFYSASPPRQVKAFIEFLAKPNEEQFKKITNLNKETIDAIKLNEDKEDIYNHFFEDICHGYYPNKITVYNVGQGNSVKIQLASDKNEDSFAIVFDIGRSRRLGEGKIFDKNAEKAAKNLSNKSMFILSHWDLDHIQGVIYLRKEQFETTWIVPQLPSGASKSAERLAAYLSVIHNIKDVFISSCLNGKVIFNRNNFKLGKGHGKKSNRKVGEYRTRYNDKNNLGLVLSIRGRDDQKVLLPGDCEYIQLPCEFLQEYNLMIASHHGARTQINNIGFPTGKIKNKQTIFTVNRKDSYPKLSHAVGLRRLGYKHSKSSDIGNKTFDI